jgi:hypothetical protein
MVKAGDALPTMIVLLNGLPDAQVATVLPVPRLVIALTLT